MVRVNTDAVALQVERKLTNFSVFQLVLVYVWPAPDPRIHHVWEPLTCCHLQYKTSYHVSSALGQRWLGDAKERSAYETLYSILRDFRNSGRSYWSSPCPEKVGTRSPAVARMADHTAL